MTKRTNPRAGLVLAGGRSTRFGQADKAFVELDGTPLIGHVLAKLSNSVDGLLVNCRTEQIPAIRNTIHRSEVTVGVVPDPIPDRGPAAGVSIGLKPCRAEYTAIVGCDNPLVDPEFVSYLFERARYREGAVPVVDGQLRPTMAVYETDRIQSVCESVVETGDSSLHTAVESLDTVRIPEHVVVQETERATVLDINTQNDLERAAELYDR